MTTALSGALRLLARTGATARQAEGMFGWHALFVTVNGIGAGALMAVGTLAAVHKAITGTPLPYIPPTVGVVIIGSVAVLAIGTIMASCVR